MERIENTNLQPETKSNQNFSNIYNVENSINSENIQSFDIQVIFRRKFGKKLCFVNGLKNDGSIIDVKIQNNDLIKLIKIGDKIKIKGFFKFDEQNKKDIFQCIDLLVITERPTDFNVHDMRLTTSSLETTIPKALCKYYRKNEKCLIENCIFRHFLQENEDKKLLILKEKQENMYKESHEGDTIDNKDKKHKITKSLNENF